MSRGSNLPGKAAQSDGRVHDYLTRLSKSVLLLIIGAQYISMLLLGWKVYSPNAWLPMPPVSTFLVASTMLVVLGFLWINRATYKGE